MGITEDVVVGNMSILDEEDHHGNVTAAFSVKKGLFSFVLCVYFGFFVFWFFFFFFCACAVCNIQTECTQTYIQYNKT